MLASAGPASERFRRTPFRALLAGTAALSLGLGAASAQEIAALDLPDAPGYTSPANVATPVPSGSPEPSASFTENIFSASSPSLALPTFAEPVSGRDALKSGVPPVAGVHDPVILPGQQAPKLTIYNKVILGVKDGVSPFSMLGWLVATGYEQVTDGSPNYGQTGKGFAQRLGSSAARDFSEEVFSDSILAPVLHEDPRYYKMGKGHPFFKRVVYSATRTIFTRTDGGHQTINFSGLGGNLAGSALTQAYYPPLNRGFDEVAKTFAGGIGSNALGFLVNEFLDDTLEFIHLKKTTP